MKKVVLLAINAKYVHSSLSIWVIATGIEKLSLVKHDVKVIEATINQSCVSINDLIIEHKPDVVGISAYIWNAKVLPEILERLKEQIPEVIIVLGGPEASYNADYWYDKGADHVLQGEGEYVFPQFLDTLTGYKNVSTVNTQKSIMREETSHIFDPYSDNYLSTLNGRLSYIETSRGCPFKCSFCLSAGTEVKYFPLDVVKDQITKLSKANTKTVKFVDRTFNCNAKRAIEIFSFVIGLDTKCCFHFEVAADLFTAEMFSVLEAAPNGRIQFEIGLQSFYEPALKASSRVTDIKKAEQNIRILVGMQNIHIHIDLIAGLPYETLPDFIDSFNRAYALNTNNLQLGFLKLLHGSELRKNADSLGIIFNEIAPYEIISAPWLNEENISDLKLVENALAHTRNKERFLSAIYYVLTITGKSPYALLYLLGAAVPNHGTQLEDYIVQIYDFFSSLPNVDINDLKDCFIFDWLSMVKGKNIPVFLKNDSNYRKHVEEEAQKVLCRKIRREEFAVLNSGIGIFVDSNERNPVTGLYKVYICG